ncbi:hypothetical protein D0962_09705 [Leptolyngbyaceae cyanobacterium CCMR0082]|uniref:Lipoprotein n=2 Tax=Adonisia turfae TaxID=2950184 RepID=A0A6M0S5F3_9CYAN|nr:hypothetical protein [Adonisia turfae]MDV3351678.1 hypothetical protein [Leptothoe sp. LEGE 181152]NEZ55167.1 hypothetical protein [Adonisia turfae CCMR0081]NEZ63052.1 hypothetical protein [Adonisia turfae CCMR0082]
MRLSRSILPVGLAALTLASCGPSKVAQCNAFADVINQAQVFKDEFETEIDSFTQQAQGAESLGDIQTAATQYISAVEKVVVSIDGMVTSLGELELADEQLSQYRDGYAEIISGSATELNVAGEAMQLVANAESETDLSNVLEEFQGKANNAFTNLQTLSQNEATLVNDINTYCGAEVPIGTEETAPAAPADE